MSKCQVLALLFLILGFPAGSDGKCLPAMQETWVWSLDQEDSPGEGNGNPSSTLVWKIPWTEESYRLQSMGSQRVRHNWTTSLSLSRIFTPYSLYTIHSSRKSHSPLFLFTVQVSSMFQDHYDSVLKLPPGHCLLHYFLLLLCRALLNTWHFTVYLFTFFPISHTRF